MRIDRTLEVTLDHEELCEAIRDWVNLHGSENGIEILTGNVEMLGDDLIPFSYDITARIAERT